MAQHEENQSLVLVFNKNNNSEIITISPNPNTGVFKINYCGIPMTNKHVFIYDLLGKILWDSKFPENELTLDLSKQPPGVYSLKIELTSTTHFEKIIIH